ncbi:hypothetical protein [Paraburkholderia sp. BCC1886]|uniref:hypothetical protein n=1 Tax=Paraburkholderia sp. BCC1886 TaxID=2562670 RepID=UPI001182D9B9|nr:hypothetical protein [Paraburkholderia sp. BCC1886]
MRLNKKEWAGALIVAGSIACFGMWLQSEMTRASFARIQRTTEDVHGTCTSMSLQDSAMMDRGELWCGPVDAAATTHSGSMLLFAK